VNTSIHAEAEAKLRAERERLVHQLDELGATETGELRNDVDFGDGFADAAAATAERTETLGLIENLHETLVGIDEALGRIADGSYGRCVKCGNEISAARLEFRPESVLCVSCKTGS
jgi:RNA polymerase-binding transcription factor DksA